MIITRFTTIFLLLTLSLITKAQKDSFWLRNINLMGAPKAVFVLDDGHSIVLADSFDNTSGKYKGIIFFKIDPNGKTVKRQQIAKIDKHLLEQKVERVDKLADYILIKSYYLLDNDSSRKHYIFYKINFSGEILNSFQENIQRYWIVGDTLIQHIHWEKVLYRSLNDFSVFDSIYYKEAISWYFLNENENTFTEIYTKNIKDKYDSVVIVKRTLKLDTLRLFTKNIYTKELIRPRPTFKFVGDDYLFLSYNNELVKTDTNLNILWQTPPEFIKAVEEEITDVHILNNSDIIVVGNTQMANGEYTPYFTCISGDGLRRKFQYALPSFIAEYHSFSEGPSGELYFLVSNPNETFLAKISPWGQLNSIKEETKALEIQVYPNPTSEKINVKFNRQISGHISIISMKGTEMQTFQIENKRNTKMDLSDLPGGSYYLLVKPKDGFVYSKMLFKP